MKIKIVRDEFGVLGIKGVIFCCNQMALTRNVVLSYSPTLGWYARMGVEKISHCPFCGSKIQQFGEIK